MSPQRLDVQIFVLQVYAIYIGFHIYFTFLTSLVVLSKLGFLVDHFTLGFSLF